MNQRNLARYRDTKSARNVMTFKEPLVIESKLKIPEKSYLHNFFGLIRNISKTISYLNLKEL